MVPPLDEGHTPLSLPARPPAEPLDLVVHIGTGATGASLIQHFLERNRARLADLGYLYPQTPGRTRHTRLGLFLQPDTVLENNPRWHTEGIASPADLRRAFRRRLFREINQSGRFRVLLSDEGLYGSSVHALRRLSRFADRVAGSLRLVVYLRRQDDHLLSRYQQVVKGREARRLTDRMQHENLARTYDYHSRLRLWERTLEPTEFVVRRYESGSFSGGSLCQDFLDAAHVDGQADHWAQVEQPDESLDAEAVELLRILNVYRREDESATSLLPDNRALVPRLARACSGPALTLPTTVLDEFMARWEQSNQAVAMRFLGDDRGQLFRAPRTSNNTTAEQTLDPARLDHFIALLRLPESTHGPLRQLVERESTVR
jgi:hypothetical protein